MAIKVYDPTQVGVIVGTSPINGFAEDSMITIEMEDPQYVVATDISGSPTRFKTNKALAKVTIRLTQTSPSNDLLINSKVTSPTLIRPTYQDLLDIYFAFPFGLFQRRTLGLR